MNKEQIIQILLGYRNLLSKQKNSMEGVTRLGITTPQNRMNMEFKIKIKVRQIADIDKAIETLDNKQMYEVQNG